MRVRIKATGHELHVENQIGVRMCIAGQAELVAVDRPEPRTATPTMPESRAAESKGMSPWR